MFHVTAACFWQHILPTSHPGPASCAALGEFPGLWDPSLVPLPCLMGFAGFTQREIGDGIQQG